MFWEILIHGADYVTTAQIAREMIVPQSGSNSIMQLNMGLGKSSVIVPIVAATLADRSKLARVVALKSLSEQMFQLLVSKLGGLIGRRIYRLPISRFLTPSWQSANLIQNIYQECMACGGILLVQPESNLSFELLGIDYLLSRELNSPELEMGLVPSKTTPGKSLEPSIYEVRKVMLQTQQWLCQHARDILDESDEILSVRVELICTLGIQQNIQFSPDRWSAIQRVLGVLSETTQEVLDEFPQGLEIILRASWSVSPHSHTTRDGRSGSATQSCEIYLQKRHAFIGNLDVFRSRTECCS